MSKSYFLHAIEVDHIFLQDTLFLLEPNSSIGGWKEMADSLAIITFLANLSIDFKGSGKLLTH